MKIFKFLIYTIIPSWLYYQLAFFIKKRRLKRTNINFPNKKNFESIFNIMRKKKINEKVFIFGSGSSIKELTIKNFDEINKYFSIGINKWIFHDFITNCYMIELTDDDNLNEKFRARILVLLRNTSKSPIFLIYRSRLSDSIKLQKWMRGMNSKRVFFYEYLRPDIFKKNVKSEFVKSLRFIEKNINSNVLTLGVGTTIERAISLTLSLGYRRLIILGVDLKDTKYFWTDKDINFKEISTDQKNVGYHKTAIRVLGSIPVQETIVILDKIAREFYDSRILISTNKSMLSSDLEKYNWKNN